ncbi:hypothetical protein H6G01_00640 [Leptolyngbya sp. FACHB-17]|nr:hypothetical protein [Leptolyngbya sp. FACHB-17]
MKTIKLKNLITVGLTIASVSSATAIAEPAKADLFCWPWETDCIVNGRPGSSGDDGGSCLQVMTHRDYKFTIKNGTRTPMYYAINGQQYQLNPGYQIQHSYPAARGSNSCNVTTFSQPIIRYDGYRRSGYQEIRLGLSNSKVYEFSDYDNDHIAFYLR